MQEADCSNYSSVLQAVTPLESVYMLCIYVVCSKSIEPWQLHHDNTPAHSAHLIQTFVAKHNIPVVRQAPYCTDMAPCDFWLFPKLKMPLKETRFESREDIMQNATARRSRSVSNNGGSAGRSVCITKETTLKGIRVLYLQINKCISADQRFDTF
jgi:hypothetical protein